MLNLDMLDTEVSAIFSPAERGEPIAIPEPSSSYRDQIESFNTHHLTQQYIDAVHAMRCWQLERLGFTQVAIDKVVDALMGKPHNHYWDGERTEHQGALERQNLEWMFNHLSGTVLSGKACNWGSRPTQYYRTERVAPCWWLPPFMLKEVWRVQFGKLNYLKKPITVEIASRMAHAKKLGLFNAFAAVAPMDAWTSTSANVEAVLIGSVFPFNITQDNSGSEAHFYLGRW